MEDSKKSSDIRNVKYLLHYEKYQESSLSLEDYCRLNSLDYLEFVKFVNKWDDVHGRKAVEGCMDRIDMSRPHTRHADYLPSRAQSLFKELVVKPEKENLRSFKRFPSNPDLMVSIEHPNPGTIVRAATILFPSGIELHYEDATIKSLILSVVLYEEADSWIEQ